MNNYKELIENLQTDKIEELLLRLGAEKVERKDNFLITNTICHNVDGGSMKLYYYFDTHLFYCYTSCERMSIFSFLKHYYECRGVEYNWFEDILNVVENCAGSIELDGFEAPVAIQKRESYQKRETVEFETINEGILEVFNKYYAPEWLNDGISKEAMDKFNIKYSISQNKIIIPHYDIHDNLIGIRGRALDDWEIENIGKYMPVKIEGTWYRHKLGMNLYGLNITKENIRKKKRVFVFEAEKSVMQMESFKQLNCGVAVCGSQFNKYQLNLLLKNCYPEEIVICFDNEEMPGEDKYFMKLWNLCKKYNNYCTFSFIYDRGGLLNLKDSPTDKGEEIFNQLLLRRVFVK